MAEVTGISNGRCSSRVRLRLRQAAIRPLREGHAGRCATTSVPGSTTRTSWPASSRTTTSRGRRDVSAGHAPSRRGHHLPVTRAAILPPGTVRRRRNESPLIWSAAPQEPVDRLADRFYEGLLAVLGSRWFATASGRLLDAAGLGRQLDVGLFRRLGGSEARRRLVAVNYAPHQSQCYVRVAHGSKTNGSTVRLTDLAGPASYERNAREMASRGLYLDLPSWGYHVFEWTAG